MPDNPQVVSVEHRPDLIMEIAGGGDRKPWKAVVEGKRGRASAVAGTKGQAIAEAKRNYHAGRLD